MNEKGCKCHGCGNMFKIDFMVRNEIWKKITPKGEEGGLLCGACITNRMEAISDFSAFAIVDIDEYMKLRNVHAAEREKP